MSNWILNRLISFSLDNAAVFEAGAAVVPDRAAAEALRLLARESASAAHEVAALQQRLGGRALFAGTPQGAARCRSVQQAAALGTMALPGVLAMALRSVTDALAACEGFATLNLPPLVKAAVELTYADLRMGRFELSQLLEGGRGPVGPRTGTATEIRFGLSRG